MRATGAVVAAGPPRVERATPTGGTLGPEGRTGNRLDRDTDVVGNLGIGRDRRKLVAASLATKLLTTEVLTAAEPRTGEEGAKLPK